MIEKLPFEITQGEYEGKKFDIKSHASPYDIQEKVNEIIDWINNVSAFCITDKQVTANMPNIDVGELAFLSKKNSDLKDEIDRLLYNNEILSKQLNLALVTLKKIDETRAASTEKLFATNGETLNSGILFCLGTPDQIHNTLKNIQVLEKKKQ